MPCCQCCPNISFGGERCPQTLQIPLTPVCEPLSLTELSLRKGVSASSSHSISPGFHLCRVCSEPLVPGTGMEMPNKNPVKEHL